MQMHATSLLIGVSGKRELGSNTSGVCRSTVAIFGHLDREFPHTPKVLLSSLAVGADRIAAQEALKRNGWSVVAVLPLAAELYCEDFDEAAAIEFRTLLAHERVRTYVLPPLLDPASGVPFARESLHRKAGISNPSRSQHYEQSGLFIARASMLMLAVMDASEMPGRVGGTARIARYRVTGSMDEVACDVTERSAVLTPPSPLDMAHPRPLLLIDLAAMPTTPPATPFAIFDGAGKHRLDDRLQSRRCFQLPRALELFNRQSASGRADANAPQDSAQALRSSRTSVTRLQARAVTRVRQSVSILAALFAAAVTSWEVYVERAHIHDGYLGIGFYVGLVCAAIGLYLIARHMLWQPIADDYRAVAEALRVQIAWWEAGLAGPDHRVDAHYLARGQGSLGLVRQAIAAMIDAATLLFAPPRRVPDSEALWIDAQIAFFCDRTARRERRLLMVELSSWFLFLSSLGAASVLLVLEVLRMGGPLSMAGQSDGPILATIFIGAAVPLLVVLILLARSRPGAIMHLTGVGKPLLKPQTWLLSLIVGAVIATGIARLSVDPDVAETVIGVMLISTAAIGGAIRYLADALSWEAELHGYSDALDVFRTARSALADNAVSGRAEREKEQRRRAILTALGRKALAENESWLRAHRERPLQPVVGA
ncbi:MAG: hypothetical protein WDM86_00360 [Rhizomicrobium sp.]